MAWVKFSLLYLLANVQGFPETRHNDNNRVVINEPQKDMLVTPLLPVLRLFTQQIFFLPVTLVSFQVANVRTASSFFVPWRDVARGRLFAKEMGLRQEPLLTPSVGKRTKTSLWLVSL